MKKTDDTLILPNGTTIPRYVTDMGVKREVVLIVTDSEDGYRLSYRDAMVEGDEEMEADESTTDYSRMTKAQLVEALDAKGIEHPSGATKQDLINLLPAAE